MNEKGMSVKPGKAQPGPPPMGRGRYLYIVQMDVPAEFEAEFNRIYDTEHAPQFLKVLGSEIAGGIDSNTQLNPIPRGTLPYSKSIHPTL